MRRDSAVHFKQTDDGDILVDGSGRPLNLPKPSVNEDVVTGVVITTGSPSDDAGIDGSYAIDPVEEVLYGPKAKNKWPPGKSFKEKSKKGASEYAESHKP